MKNTLLYCLLLLLSTHFVTAQCGANEIEIKVEIETDNWGYETYWNLTALTGEVILEGGQGGLYDNFASYSASACVADDGCFFFEIFDTYGDGILAPVSTADGTGRARRTDALFAERGAGAGRSSPA